MDAALAESPPFISIPNEILNPHPDVQRQRLNLLRRHCGHVRENAQTLADALFDRGERALAVELAARGLRHDAGKFVGEEWLCLHQSVKQSHPSLFFKALEHHQRANDHHPEFFHFGVRGMARVQVAEMCCDWLARSQEFGSDLREWIAEVASPRYGITQDSRPWLWIEEFLDVLLDKRFN